MKKVLIISPFFPPINAADMQRVRMSLPYFKKMGWEAEVLCVDPAYCDMPIDELLVESIPTAVKIHQVIALNKKYTSKIGLGSLALRSWWCILKKVNSLLKQNHYDLIYFSTTQFPLLTLGAYWKKKFNVPYVIDMQDPWHSEYYEQNPSIEKPAKYWFSYRLNKYLEPIAMKKVDGLISVSQGYLTDLNQRYPNTLTIPQAVITFGAFEEDMNIAKKFNFGTTILNNKYKNIVYIGRGGQDMHLALNILFEGFKLALERNFEQFENIRFNFLGTSYAPQGQGRKTILPLAEKFGLENYVFEQTDRIPFYESLNLLKQANALLIIGSNDRQYTASKIYPYILAQKPLLALFHSASSAAKIIKECDAGIVIPIDQEINTQIVYHQLNFFLENESPKQINWEEFKQYTAENMTKAQCDLFDQVLNQKNRYWKN